MLLDKGDDIPDNKEVISELGLLYYLKFIIKSLLYLWSRLGVVLGQTLIAKISQKLVSRLPFR